MTNRPSHRSVPSEKRPPEAIILKPSHRAREQIEGRGKRLQVAFLGGCLSLGKSESVDKARSGARQHINRPPEGQIVCFLQVALVFIGVGRADRQPMIDGR